MLFNLSDYAPEPLHKQLCMQIADMILNGDLKPGSRLLKVSQMAKEQKISNRTVRRSYQDLVNMGLIREETGNQFRVIKTDQVNVKSRPVPSRKNSGYVSYAVRTENGKQADKTAYAGLKREMRKAAEIQKALLAAGLPENPFITVRTFSVSSQSIGGDLVDVFHIDQKRVGLLIADACGSGVPAALLIAQVRAIIRNESRHTNRPGLIINQLARQIEDILPRDSFITLFFAVYELNTRCLRFVNAGHPLPYLYSQQAGEKTLPGINPALGIVRGYDYKAFEKKLGKWDCLLLYTDGVSEARNQLNQEYGEKRIETIFQRYHNDPNRLIDSLIRDLNAFTSTQLANDDRSLLAVRIKK